MSYHDWSDGLRMETNDGRFQIRVGGRIQYYWDFFGDERVVDVHVRNLRSKLGDAAADPEFVGTVRGVFPRFSIGSSVPPAAAGAPVPGSASRSRVGSWKLTTENSSPSLMVPVAAPHSPCAFP